MLNNRYGVACFLLVVQGLSDQERDGKTPSPQQMASRHAGRTKAGGEALYCVR
ncbi:uncharacterized protein GLRG_05147 [Colletotrichum graminicola M1.001]|uniref:Uncharacterized protein n=1 Tax=Colletotrichum graminicola (strain M1.001 / M2 / FGSC 10212) TaxID=645133 RepID=E3QGL5_COLGM|nr:uncharacterized protein GLRG_05147 [Colletotrichum graminicola M1.001]EFQ30003.1 hypothetical protein GLRG_05147 [Colletotrichum graminicola M1.001]